MKCKQCCRKPAPSQSPLSHQRIASSVLSPPFRPQLEPIAGQRILICPPACSSPQPPPRPPTSASFPKRKARAPSLCSSGTTTPPHRAARASGTEAAAGTRTASTRTSSAPGPAGNTVRASRYEMQPPFVFAAPRVERLSGRLCNGFSVAVTSWAISTHTKKHL